MRRLAALLCLSAMLAPLLAGCQHSTEINALSLVMGIAIDKGDEENEYEVTAQIARAEVLSGGDSQSNSASGDDEGFLNISKKGVGISAAMLEISQLMNRKFYTGHIQVVVISREVAESGIGPIIDYFIGSTDGRLSTALLIAADEAKALFESGNPLDHSPASNLAGLLRAQVKAGEISESSILTFLDDMIGSLTSATVPVAEVVKDDSGKEFAEITGVAAFDGLELRDVMTINQSRAVLTTKDKITGGYLKVDRDGKYLTLQLEKTSTQVSSEIVDGKPKITVRVVREYTVDDSTWDFDYLEEEQRLEAEGLAEHHAYELLNDALEWARERGLDVFGFGERLYRYHRRDTEELLRNWSEAFPELEVELEVDITVLGSGAILQNLKPIEYGN